MKVWSTCGPVWVIATHKFKQWCYSAESRGGIWTWFKCVGLDAATESTIIDLLQELRSQGKTILVVHHDLPTARRYFDSLILLNLRLIAYGPVEEVFKEELLQRAYGGRLTILSEVADATGEKSKVDLSAKR